MPHGAGDGAIGPTSENDDADAIAAKATAEGGQVVAEPFDIPSVGRSAVLSDPQGGMFSVLKPASPPQ